MTSNPLHLFVEEPAFIDPTSLTYDPSKGGSGHLSAFSKSYFQSPRLHRDPRPERTTDRNVGANSRARAWFDEDVSQAEMTLLASASSDIWSIIFSLIDHVGFSILPQQGVEDINRTLQDTFDVYVPNTLRFDTGTALASVFREDGSSTDIVIPSSARLQIEVSIPAPENNADNADTEDNTDEDMAFVRETQEIWFWFHDDAFRENYPVSHVTTVLLPLRIENLLRGSLTDEDKNAFNQGRSLTTRHNEQLGTALQTYDNSGSVQHSFCVKNNAGDDILMPFILIYKGAKPDREIVRQAIRTHLLDSGVGTRDDWKARIPDLFIDGQIFLVPMWSNTVKRPSDILHANVIGLGELINYILATLPQIDRDYAIVNSAVFTASYDLMPVVAVPHPDNFSTFLFQDLHETFQPTRTTDPSFVQMDSETKDLAVLLNNALAVAADKSENDDFPIETTSNGRFVPFSVQNIEYMVMTEETFINKTEGAS